jgi:hypothetical protein
MDWTLVKHDTVEFFNCAIILSFEYEKYKETC